MGLELAQELIQPSMGKLVDFMACATLYPPVVKCDTIYGGPTMVGHYQRLEWPKLLFGQGYIKVIDLKSQSTIRIQSAGTIDPMAVKFKMTERGRDMLLHMARDNDYEISGVNQTILWANTNDLIRQYHQADIKDVDQDEEPMEDDVVIDDIIVVDSGRGSSMSRSAQPTPEGPPLMSTVPMPSARAPTPSPDDDIPTNVDEALTKITDVVEQLQKMYEKTMGDVHSLQKDMVTLKKSHSSQVIIANLLDRKFISTDIKL